MGHWQYVTDWADTGYMGGRYQLSQWICPGHPHHGSYCQHAKTDPPIGPPKSNKPEPHPPGTKWNL